MSSGKFLNQMFGLPIAILAGREVRLAPKPPITPIVNKSVVTLGLSVESPSPIQVTRLPTMHIGLSPYLFESPPIIGPNTNVSPLKSELAQETVESFEP